MARIGYIRAVTVLVAIAAATVVAVLVAYGTALGETNPTALVTGAPTVRNTIPADNATNVDPAANITARFSEKMLASSINNQNVRLYEGNYTAAQLNPDPNCTMDCPAMPADLGAPVSYVVQKKGKKRVPTAVVDPSNPLKEFTTYTLVIEGAGDTDDLAVEDRAGNEMRTEKVTHFTTGPCVPACG